ALDPAVNQLDNVYLYDIDDLEGVVTQNRGARAREAAKAETIVEAEVDTFWRWYTSLDVVPTIVALRERMEAIRRHEVERSLAARGKPRGSGGRRGAGQREHRTGPRRGRPSARALELADGVRGHRRSGARAAREHRTGPRRGRPSARALELADGVRGHRRSGARAAREHRTGPRESWAGTH